MKTQRTYPRFKGCEPASQTSSRTKSANRKTGSKHEEVLCKRLWSKGLRYHRNHRGLPGTPDIVFTQAGLAIFCDGDFWHGRDWEDRRAKLVNGRNATYWIAKLERNRERATEVNQQLRAAGWTVLRLWETDILKDPEGTADLVKSELTRLRRERESTSGR